MKSIQTYQLPENDVPQSKITMKEPTKQAATKRGLFICIILFALWKAFPTHSEIQVVCDKFQAGYWSALYILYMYLYVDLYVYTVRRILAQQLQSHIRLCEEVSVFIQTLSSMLKGLFFGNKSLISLS